MLQLLVQSSWLFGGADVFLAGGCAWPPAFAAVIVGAEFSAPSIELAPLVGCVVFGVRVDSAVV